MSGLEKDMATVLEIRAFSETSCVVSWFTENYGRIFTLVKGAHRPKGGWLGRLDLFYTDEIVFYYKEPRGLHLLKECEPVNIRREFREHWRATAAASYLARLLTDICPLDAPHPELFALFNDALDQLQAAPKPALDMLRLELQILSTAGLAPQLNVCVQCMREPCCNHAQESLLFSPTRGGLLCKNCAPHLDTNANGAFEISSELLQLLLCFQQGLNPPVPCSDALLNQGFMAIARFLLHHLDFTVAARTAAIEMLAGGRILNPNAMRAPCPAGA